VSQSPEIHCPYPPARRLILVSFQYVVQIVKKGGESILSDITARPVIDIGVLLTVVYGPQMNTGTPAYIPSMIDLLNPSFFDRRNEATATY
jgi:hypothetical protein